MNHDLKIWPQFFEPLVEGKKRAELRRDDREPRFAKGDQLKLREWDPKKEEYTGKYARARIIHVDRGAPIPEGWALLSIAPL